MRRDLAPDTIDRAKGRSEKERVPEINGICTRDGSHDGIGIYRKYAQYQGKEEEFSRFWLRLTDGSRYGGKMNEEESGWGMMITRAA
jgi:hypothetical protein